MTISTKIVPVILAGGGGTRLWPLSRGHYPKQFLVLDGEYSLLQQTLRRLPGIADLNVVDALVVCNEEHRFLVAEQSRQCGATLSDLILEPIGRNTAPALTAAAIRASRQGDDPVLVMMPADHLIGDLDGFAKAMLAAVAVADAGQLVTFGVVPTRAETGYGYIEVGERVGTTEPTCYALAGFREKPALEIAQAYVASEKYLWNSGIYVMRASVWLKHCEHFCFAIARDTRAAVEGGSGDADFFRLESTNFGDCPSESIDCAVTEPLAASGEGAVVVALHADWSDIGVWSSVWQRSDKDSNGNVLRGDVCAVESQENLIFAEHRLVATIGCRDLVIVETADAVLVAERSQTENVKSIVDWLSAGHRAERLTHRRVYRPWGSYQGIDAGPRFQVKRIIVNPSAALSLQMHEHRAEHWIVVSGTARVTRGEEIFLLAENESTYIPIRVKHRLENPGTLPLELIEVQSGSYLGEDDIVRFEDKYRRV